MSRRDIAVNVLLGAVLLLIFAIPFILLVLSGGLLFRVLGPSVEQYFSRLGIPQGFWELLLFGMFLLWKRFRPSDFKEI
ncbi:MAG TPA: hypothetical protein VFO46_14545 [Candidatus Sulfotelmatobacter sp.]|nr:hypothetical protein [Candidatus Sulfotelmatobacter sp.]